MSNLRIKMTSPSPQHLYARWTILVESTGVTVQSGEVPGFPPPSLVLRTALKSLGTYDADSVQCVEGTGGRQYTVTAPATIRGKVLRTNPDTGMNTIAFPGRLVALIALAQGKTWDEVISQARGGRINKAGQFTFRCGVGYDVISADLLGGSADGKAYSDFQKVTGISLRH